MKGILEFDLNDHDESLAFIRASKATKAYIALLKIQEELKRTWESCELTEDQDFIVTQLKDLINAIVEDHVNIFEELE